MHFSGYLAMTGAEIAACRVFSPKIACMSCHFSSASTGIAGIPASLPTGSALILTDEIPITDQIPQRVARELAGAADRLGCKAVILDLQRPHNPKAKQMAAALKATLSCPLVVSELYADRHDAVLVSSPPLWTPLKEHLKPWEGRKIWLEAVLDGATVTVTEAESRYEPCEPKPLSHCHKDPMLHITYHVQTQEREARIHLRRGKTELTELMAEARALGVEEFLGLYQQLAPLLKPNTSHKKL